MPHTTFCAAEGNVRMRNDIDDAACGAAAAAHDDGDGDEGDEGCVFGSCVVARPNSNLPQIEISTNDRFFFFSLSFLRRRLFLVFIRVVRL